MKQRLSFLWLKIRLSARTILWVFTKWRYAVLALVVAFLFFELIYWLFNLSVLGVVLGSVKLSIFDKLEFLIDPILSLGSIMGAGTASMMLLLSLVQGMNIALLTYIIRNQPKVEAKAIGGSAFIGVLAVIGIGCPACGTSLIAPVVALFVSGSAVAVSETITRIALPIALAAGFYGLYALGIQAANVKAIAAQRS